jgi:hypothetical protein
MSRRSWLRHLSILLGGISLDFSAERWVIPAGALRATMAFANLMFILVWLVSLTLALDSWNRRLVRSPEHLPGTPMRSA